MADFAIITAQDRVKKKIRFYLVHVWNAKSAPKLHCYNKKLGFERMNSKGRYTASRVTTNDQENKWTRFYKNWAMIEYKYTTKRWSTTKSDQGHKRNSTRIKWKIDIHVICPAFGSDLSVNFNLSKIMLHVWNLEVRNIFIFWWCIFLSFIKSGAYRTNHRTI